MSTQHELVVDLDKNEITLNGMYLGNNHNVEVRYDHSPWDGGSATITLHQVTLQVIANNHTHLAEALGAQKGGEES